MILSMLLPPANAADKWMLAKQMGVTHAITKAAPELSGLTPPYDFNSLKTVRENFAAAGIKLVGLEGDQFDMSAIKLGLDNRDECIEKYRQMLRNMGRLDINLLCFNFMAVIGWYRSRADIVERGGALTSCFDCSHVGGELVEESLRISEEKVWENLFYFLDAVLPVAEEAGVKMGMHPDDPPLSPLMGVGRVLTSAANYNKVLDKFPSPNLGVTFCQATFKTMGEDLKKVSGEWLRRKKIFFIHIRDTEGGSKNFRETFIDEKPGFIADMLDHYHSHGFDGVIRSDHAPAMHGEAQKDFGGGISVGYQMMGHLFANGYIKGCCDALKIPLK